MTQELEFGPITEEDKTSLAEGQLEEEKYHDEIPEEFYRQCVTANAEILRAEQLFSKTFGKHVTATYVILRKADIPVESARKIVVGRFIKYRSMATIRRYLPDEPKDKRQQAAAIKSNAKQQADKEKEMEQAIKKEYEELGMDYNERVISGKKGGNMTVIKNGTDYMAINGSKGGKAQPRTRKEKIQHAARLAVSEEVVDEVVANQVKEIVIELPEPDYTDEQSQARTMWSCKIEQLWNKFHKAYLKVDINGSIKSVYNADPVPHTKQLEEPIANSH